MILPEHVLCHIPRVFEIFREIFLKKWIFGGKFWKIMSYDFQSSRQIMTLGGVYQDKNICQTLNSRYLLIRNKSA